MRLLRNIAVLAGAILVLASGARAVEPDIPLEYQVKAAFIHNFMKFVDWPEDRKLSDGDRYRIGVYGDGPILDALLAIQDKQIHNRKLQIVRIGPRDSIKDLHVLLIQSKNRKKIGRLLKSARGHGILTIGDTEAFSREGGIISFLLEDGKIRFAINLDTALQENIRISSKLLRLARIVKSE